MRPQVQVWEEVNLETGQVTQVQGLGGGHQGDCGHVIPGTGSGW